MSLDETDTVYVRHNGNATTQVYHTDPENCRYGPTEDQRSERDRETMESWSNWSECDYCSDGEPASKSDSSEAATPLRERMKDDDDPIQDLADELLSGATDG